MQKNGLLHNLTKVNNYKVFRFNENSYFYTAKQAIDLPGMTTTRLLYTDYYLTIRRARNSKWQREWENSTSKLHYIKPHIKEWESAYNSCRQYEVKLSRIRIGHSRLTHGHVLSRNEPPLN